ncbi:MAG: hypothetical protein RMK19_05365 [Bacteroidia bacterium]|nr:hypothetical protein [Bacteroidia bacterium]
MRSAMQGWEGGKWWICWGGGQPPQVAARRPNTHENRVRQTAPLPAELSIISAAKPLLLS